MASDRPEVHRVVEADVYKGDVLAGRLRRTGRGTVFGYARSYRAARLPAVAVSLPVSAQPVTAPDGRLPPFFAGLLPGGARLRALAARLGASPRDTLSLLVAVGGDCVGDVRVAATGHMPSDPPALAGAGAWSEVDFEDLRAATVAPGGGRVEQVALPGAGVTMSAAPSLSPLTHPSGSHILKLDPPGRPRLAENEKFCLDLAEACGLAVAQAEVVHDRHGRSGLLVRRFDREALPNGSLRRLAQEDACQFLGRQPGESRGPTVSDIAGAVARWSDVPLIALRDLVRLLAVSHLVGNADLHARDISIGTTLTDDVTLTPAYDLHTTLPYRASPPVRGAGLGLDRGELTRSRLRDLGGRFGLAHRAVDRSLDRICDEAGGWLARLGEIGFEDHLTARLAQQVAGRRDDLGRR
ncbi:MAG: type II toxin-antitoxin system HipA family toxin [Carbonactinosporaceae bacterium]